MKRFRIVTTALIVTAVIAAGCSSSSDSAKSGKSDAASASCDNGVVAQPDNQGAQVLGLIAGATKTVDIIIYQINDLATSGNLGPISNALISALGNNVAVRIIMDSGGSNVTKVNGPWVKAFTASSAFLALTPAQQAAFQANWSSNNFSLTHQKTVIIDAAGSTGSGVPCLMVSTGNFAGFEGAPFYAARDFYMSLSDENLISQASAVFNSDFACAGNTVTNGIVGDTDGPLLYSNGQFALGSNAYPPLNGYYSGGYGLLTTNVGEQGNVGAYQVGILNAAQSGDVLSIYDEELKSSDLTTVDGASTPNRLWSALLAALGRGAKVNVVMSAPPSYFAPKAGSSWTGQDADYVTLANAGANVHILAPESWLQSSASGYSGVTYIHAKSFLLFDSAGNFKDGYAGSINGSQNSIYFARELGLALKSYPSIASSILATFNKDFAISGKSSAGVPWMLEIQKFSPGPPAYTAPGLTADGPYPVAWYANGSSSGQSPDTTVGSSGYAPNTACGAAYTPTPVATTTTGGATTTTSTVPTSTTTSPPGSTTTTRNN